MITIFLVFLALLCLGLLALTARGFNRRITNFEDLETKLRVVDLRAFQTLSDPNETEFLRTRLGPSRFRAVERRRIRAMMGYLGAISENAKILLAIGALAKRSEHEHVADAAQELIDTALRTRLLVIAMYARMLPAWVFPSIRGAHLDKVVAGYEQLKEQLIYLVSMDKPMVTSRAASLL